MQFTRGLIAVLGLLLAPALADAKPVRIKISSPVPERSVWGKALEEISEEVKRETGNAVKIKIYHAGVQGDEMTVLRKMRIGQLHGAALVGQGMAEVCPDTHAVKQPLLFETFDEVAAVFPVIQRDLIEHSRGRGYEVMGFPHLGFTYLFSKSKIEKLDTLRASRPWLIQNDVLCESLFDALEITPVATSITDVLTGLQSGVIGAVFTPPVGLIAMQWHTHVASRLDLKLNYSVGIVTLSEKAWKKIPAEHHAKVREIFARKIDELSAKTREQNREALEVMAKKGVTVSKCAPKSLEAFQKATAEVTQKMAGKHFSKKSIERLHELLAKYRKGETEDAPAEETGKIRE